MGIMFWWVSRPNPGIDPATLNTIQGDIKRGELSFHIGGCVSCHAQIESEQTSSQNEFIILSGGRRLETPFGTFVAPNITPHPEKGIGSWNTTQFVNSMLYGISPQGEHYYPAFPYASYSRMSLQDIIDLKAYLDTLPKHARENEPHQLSFPFNVRAGLGLWKWLFLDQAPVIKIDQQNAELERGRYLVEGPGHCAECHTPRNKLGGVDRSRWLGGAPNPDGEGHIPNITPHANGIASWEITDIAEYLSSGFTPEYDVAGGAMAEVVENTAHLSKADRMAMAKYLHSLPPVPPNH